jgi:hypothetical protein
MHCVNALEAMRLRQNSAPPLGQAGLKGSASPLVASSVDGGCLQPVFFMVFSSATTDVFELQVRAISNRSYFAVFDSPQ